MLLYVIQVAKFKKSLTDSHKLLECIVQSTGNVWHIKSFKFKITENSYILKKAHTKYYLQGKKNTTKEEKGIFNFYKVLMILLF